MTVAMLIAPPGEPETEYAAIGPARSRARALASARPPLPRHLDESLVRQRRRGAGGALRVGAGGPRCGLIRRLMTGLALQRRRSMIVRTARDVHGVAVPIVPLPGEVSARMAVQAP